MAERAKTPIHGRSAFTLIELLVVIAVITVLAAMLLPVIRKAREQAVGVQCMGNMRQAALGYQMYALDYGLVIPVETSYINSSRGISWYKFLNGTKDTQNGNTFQVKKTYIPTMNILRCPKTTSGTYGMLHPQHTTGNYFFKSPVQPGWESFYGVRLGKLRKTSDFALLIDTITLPWSGGAPTAGAADWATDRKLGGYVSDGCIWLAHANRANVMFADFHVESCDTARLKKTSNDNYNDGNNTFGISYWVDGNFRAFNPTLP